MEDMLAIAFLIFGLAFFTWTMHDVRRHQDQRHDRELNMAREFGFEDSKLRKKGIIRKPKK